jgi:hypothetical protein
MVELELEGNSVALLPLHLFACALAALLLAASAAWLRAARARASPQEAALLAEIAAAEAEEAGLSKVSDFVRVSLLQRKVIKLLKELAARSGLRAASAAKFDGAAALSRFARPAVFAALTAACWGRPLATGLPAHALGPGAAVALAFPNLRAGDLGVVAWLAVSAAASSAVVDCVERALGLAKKPEASGVLSMLTSVLR